MSKSETPKDIGKVVPVASHQYLSDNTNGNDQTMEKMNVLSVEKQLLATNDESSIKEDDSGILSDHEESAEIKHE